MSDGNNINSTATKATTTSGTTNNTLANDASSSNASTEKPKSVKREREDDSYVFPLPPQPSKPCGPRLLAPTISQVQAPNSQTRIQNSLSNISSVQQIRPKPQVMEDGRKTPPIDYESVRGRFGWVTLGKMHIPFLLRQDDKYASVRIMERQLLKKFLQALPKEVYSCTYIKSYFITENEAKLLNEINFHHCDGSFGRDPFSSSDLVVKLGDARQFYEFLETCYIKLCDPSSGPSVDRCGFIKLNGVIVPYIMRDRSKFLPLSFFDQNMEALTMHTEKLEPWELSYIKFCCKVAGLQTDLNTEDKSSIVSLDDVKKISTALLHIEEWWPAVSQTSAPSPNKVDHPSWVTPGSTQGISSPPISKPKVDSMSEILSSQNGTSPHLISSKLPPNYGATRVTSNSLQPTVQDNTLQYPSIQTNSTPQSYVFNGQWWGSYSKPGMTGGSVSVRQSPGLVYPSVTSSSVVTNANSVNAISRQSMANNHIQNTSVLGAQLATPPNSINKPPPPLIRAPAATSLAASMSLDGSSVRSITSVPNILRPAHQPITQQQHITQPSTNQHITNSNPPKNYREYAAHNHQVRPNSNIAPQQQIIHQRHNTTPSPQVIDLTDLQTAPVASVALAPVAPPPFKPQYVYVEGKMLPSVDGGRGKRMVTVGHVATDLFPGVSPQTLLDGLKLVLRVQLQQATSSQVAALNDPLHRTGSTEFLDVLVAVEDLLQFMPQLKYMYSSRPSNQDD